MMQTKIINKIINKGLDLPIDGVPEQTIVAAPPVRRVALIGDDYVGLNPAMRVGEGDRVQLGQPLFHDKRYPEIVYTAPAGGTIAAIRRGPKRVFWGIEIAVDHENEAAVSFPVYERPQLASLTAGQVTTLLLESGQWPALRARPYSQVADPKTPAHALFVTAMDSNPLAAAPEVIIAEQREAFIDGLQVLARLVDGPRYVCQAPGVDLPQPDDDSYRFVAFAGPHPAGLVGTHIHFLAPVGPGKIVWYLHYQDVIAIGKLFTTGRVWTERVIALGGPSVKQPRLLRTRLGANTDELTQGALPDGEQRVIAGSIWSGRKAADWSAYLGRYHLQITVLPEGRQRELMGWIIPSWNKFSTLNLFLSALKRGKQRFAFNTSQQGSPRAMVPVNYEAVMPLRILPTQLLRALLVRDTDSAQALGCLELDEEDLALCGFVCVGKYDYGPALRDTLKRIEAGL